MASDNLLPFLLQNALSRAYPSAPSSNQVLYQFSLETDTTAISDSLTATTVPLGYPYGYGESIVIGHSTAGTYTYSITEQPALAYLIRMSSYIPSGSSVSLSVNSTTLSPISPAVASCYANLFNWSPATMLGRVGITPWGTPSNWTDSTSYWLGPDSSASTADPPGEWLLSKWLFVPATGTYTISLVADAQAALYINGTQIMQTVSFSTTDTTNVQLNRGMYYATIDVFNYGTSPNPTGCMVSIADSYGNIIENGNGNDWLTTGYINQPWSYSSGVPLFAQQWYVIDQPTTDNLSLSLTLAGSATVNNLWWYSVAPWKWDKGGQYDASSISTMPISPTQGGSDSPTVNLGGINKSDSMPGVIVNL